MLEVLFLLGLLVGGIAQIVSGGMIAHACFFKSPIGRVGFIFAPFGIFMILFGVSWIVSCIYMLTSIFMGAPDAS